MSSLINIYSLPKKKTLKEDNRIKIYEKVLKMCHNRIKMASNKTQSEDYTFFTIPNMIMGMPRFDTVSCCDYIMNKLAANGFKILNLGPNLIFITWSHVKFDPEKERNMEKRIEELEQEQNMLASGATPSRYPTLSDVEAYDNLSSHASNYSENHRSQARVNNFRPVYDTPNTEKYLLT